MNLRPTKQENIFLNYLYNFFLDIYEEIKEEEFWKKDSYYRLNRIRDAFLVYSEILEYEPIGWFFKALEKLRPPMKAELSREYVLFIRNLLIHVSFFKSWDEIKFTKEPINLSVSGLSIDKFLTTFTGHDPIKYRMWDPSKKTMMYISINFPKIYDDTTELNLVEFMREKEGVIFTTSLMHKVLMSQVESM